MDVTALRGRGEAEGLRPDRVRNYRVKAAHDFRCAHEGCRADRGVLVVRLPNSSRVNFADGDGGFSTRCEKHLEGLKPSPGQWIERV